MTSTLVDIPENPQEYGSTSTIKQSTEEKILSQIKNSSQTKFDLSSIIQTRQTLNYVYETAKNYMRRGALNSDNLEQLMKSSADWRSKLTQKDTMLMDILLRENVDLCAEENQNMTIYALRKKFKNELEINFLCNVVKNLTFFSNPSSVQSEVKDSSSFKKIINALSYRSIKKHEIIFNHGEKGKELFTVIKGSALCLIPDPNVKKKTALQPPKKIEIIKEQQGETKAEGTARSFLNTLAQGVNKKAVVDTNVKSFIDNLKTQYQTKIQTAPRGFLKRSSTRQLEDLIDDEERKKANWTDSEFIKHCFPNFIHVKTFVPGESFGEIALLTSQGRTATLVSRENSEFLILDKGGFEKAMDSMKKNVIAEKIEFIKSFDFFSNITMKKVLQVLQQVRILRCEVKQSIYDEGNNSNFLFLIKEGEVELRSRYANPEELAKQLNIDDEEDTNQVMEYEQLRKKKKKLNVSKMVTVKILSKGNYFGEEEIVKGLAKRQCSAICHSQDTEIYAIEKSKLQMMVGYNIFDKLKDQVSLKEGIKEERLKNAIKIQIPQLDIENLHSFMQKDKENKERQEQKERLQQELARKLKTNFQNRFEPNSQLETTIEVTDSDLQDYNEAKALESQRKAFSRMQFINLAPEPASNSNNIMTILNPQINRQIQAKYNRQHDNETIDEESNSKQRIKIVVSKSRNRIKSNFSHEEEEFCQMMGPQLQVKSFQNFLQLEEKPQREEHNLKSVYHHDDGTSRQRGPSLLIRDESATSIEGLTQSPFQTALKQKKIVLHINKSRTSFHTLDSSLQNNSQQQQQTSLASSRSDRSHRINFSSINTSGLKQNQSCSYLTKYYVKPSVKSHQQSLQSTTFNNTNSLDGPLIFIEGEDFQENTEVQQSTGPSRLVKVPRINLEKLKQKQQEIQNNSLESEDENYNIIPSSQRSQKSNRFRLLQKMQEEQIQEMESMYEQSANKRNFEPSLLTEQAVPTTYQGGISHYLETQSLENIKFNASIQNGSYFQKSMVNLHTHQKYPQSRQEISPSIMSIPISQSNTARGESNPSFIVRNVSSTSQENRVHLLSPRNQIFKKLDKADSKERMNITGNFLKERKTLKDIAPHETSNIPYKFIKNQPFQEAIIFQTGFSHFRANNQPSELNQQSIQLGILPKSESLIVKPTPIQFNTVRNQIEVKGKGQFQSQQSQTSSKEFSQDISLVQYLRSNGQKNKIPDKFSTLPSHSSKDGNEKQQVRSMLRFRKTIVNEQGDSTIHKLQQSSSSQDVLVFQPSNTSSQGCLASLSSRKDYQTKNIKTLQ